jgi:hypothetical protein
MTTNAKYEDLELREPSQGNRRGRLLARLGERAADESGQALVEFALVGTVLLMLVFGIAEFGLALNSQNDETHLANEVARYAIVNQNPGGSQSLPAWAKAQADNNIIAGGGQVCISFPNGSSNIGDPVQVKVTATMNWVPVLGVGPSTAISGTAVMRLEQPPSVYSAGCT